MGLRQLCLCGVAQRYWRVCVCLALHYILCPLVMTFLVLKGSAVLRLALCVCFPMCLQFYCAQHQWRFALLPYCGVYIPAPLPLVGSFIFSYFIHWTLVQCDGCLGRGWVGGWVSWLSCGYGRCWGVLPTWVWCWQLQPLGTQAPNLHKRRRR